MSRSSASAYDAILRLQRRGAPSTIYDPDDDDRRSVRSTSTTGTVATTASLASRLAILNIDFTGEGAEKQSMLQYEPSILEGSETSDQADVDNLQINQHASIHGQEAGSESPMHIHRFPTFFQMSSRLFNVKANQVFLKKLLAQNCEELKTNGYTVIDGLVSKDLSSHIKMAVLGLLRKGRLEEGSKSYVAAGVPPDVCYPDRTNRGDQAMWLTVGRPPADSWPLSTLLVTLQEVFEDLAQFVRLRRSGSEYQVSVHPAGSVGMTRHRDAYPDTIISHHQTPLTTTPSTAQHAQHASAAANAQQLASAQQPSQYAAPVSLAHAASGGLNGSAAIPEGDSGLTPPPAAPSTLATSGGFQNRPSTQNGIGSVQEDDKEVHEGHGSHDDPSNEPVALSTYQDGGGSVNSGSINEGQHTVFPSYQALPEASSRGQAGSVCETETGSYDADQAIPHFVLEPPPEAPQSLNSNSAHLDLQHCNVRGGSIDSGSQSPVQPSRLTSSTLQGSAVEAAMMLGNGMSCSSPPANLGSQLQGTLSHNSNNVAQQQQQHGPRRITCMVCCNTDWERDHGGQIRIWPPRRGAGGRAQRRSLAGSEAGFSQISNEDKSDTVSLRSHYLANLATFAGAASVTSSMWAEHAEHAAETASIDGSLLDPGDKDDRPGLEWQQDGDGELVLDVAPLPGRIVLLMSAAVEHAVAPCTVPVVSVNAWF